MKLVLDSSALITLAGADALDLLSLSPWPAFTVTGVYLETVEAGLARGYPDALAIQGLFEKGVVKTQDPRRSEKLAGISLTDSLVLRLGEEVRAAAVLINDQALLRKAEERGLSAQVTAQFVQSLYEAKKISKVRRDKLLSDFVANGRYSEQFLQTFVRGR